jgi:hypothetical protein
MGQRQLKRAGDIAIRKMLAREQRQKAARRVQEEKMLIAAAQHFREKGAETTLDDIAASVETYKATALPSLQKQTRNPDTMP